MNDEPTIYAIEADGLNSVKIGYTLNVSKRLFDLQAGCPVELKVLLTFYGTLAVEKHIHKELESYRIQREWFRKEKVVMDYLEAVKEESTTWVRPKARKSMTDAEAARFVDYIGKVYSQPHVRFL